MLESIFYFSQAFRGENPFGKNVNTKGTFAVILKNTLKELTEETGMQFHVRKKDSWKDVLLVIREGQSIRVCDIDGNTSAYKVRQSVEKKLKKINA